MGFPKLALLSQWCKSAKPSPNGCPGFWSSFHHPNHFKEKKHTKGNIQSDPKFKALLKNKQDCTDEISASMGFN